MPPFCGAPRPDRAPETRVVGPQPHVRGRLLRDANVGDHELAREVAAGQEEVAGLGTVEGDGEHGRRRVHRRGHERECSNKEETLHQSVMRKSGKSPE